MKISTYLSKKIRHISFLMTILIVILHSQMISISTGTLCFIQKVITEEITRIAVPLFFTISGFLYFINYHNTLADYKRKISSRTRSLLLPYLVLLLCGSIILFITERVYTISAFLEILKNGILASPPLFYPLWFLRDLYIMVLFSPLVYYIVKKAPIFIIVPATIWALGKNPPIFPCSEAILFFSVGAFFAFKVKLIEKNNNKIALSCFILWLSLCFLNCYIDNYIAQTPYAIHCIILLLGIYSIWILYDRISLYSNKNIKTADIYNYGFFIYLIHEPILTIIKKIGLYFIGNSSISIGIIYLLSPVFTIYITYFIGRYLNDQTPRLLNFITGGRAKC